MVAFVGSAQFVEPSLYAGLGVDRFGVCDVIVESEAASNGVE
jgi:hypothetical protein